MMFWMLRCVRRRLGAALLVAAGALTSSMAYAAVCTANVTALNLTLPTGTYTVPRDAPVGTQLTPFTAFPTGAPYSNLWTCNVPANTWAGPATMAVGLTDTGTTFTAPSGVVYRVYKTNLAGVGIVLGVENFVASAWFPPGWGIPLSWHQGNSWQSGGQAQGAIFGVSATFAYVKTGPMQGGTTNVSGLVAQTAMQIGSSYENVANIVVSGNATFVVAACTTPDVAVDLGSHRSSEFRGPGSYSSATGFNIPLNNCPAGMNSITYQIDATTNLISSAASVVALDGGSTATGIGVQLLDAAGNTFPLATSTAFSAYRGSTGGSYAIPMKARYYQSGASVGPGTANTSLTFTMTYR
ncbi:fimbrial protein [Paraburkholderia sp. CNPSo 3076]|uniref:fimbrial protein n=1 Tax=Paraburkholderia sp. CNPSo 3076 TaxID=2940936 RepID=UPI0022594B44|nr:fimbrial protein [Paraburkholderia sp. CNPSo 3076]MCX5540534.1 fimbrial protein [Paraburkholderia sp. CNPSo 3076]